MNARERFRETMLFGKPDRLPFMEWMFYWPETVERWQEEGLPVGVDFSQYFGYDPFAWLPVNFNFVPAFERQVLEEDELTRLVRDETGVLKREFKHGSAMPHYVEFPIKTRKDFLALKDRLDASDPTRYVPGWDDYVAQLKTRDYPVGLVSRGLLAFGRDFMEFTDLMMAFLDEKAWVVEMMDFHTEFMITLWEKAVSEVEVDLVVLGEDMAFKNGPMISPALARELMSPRYKRLTDFLKAHGVEVIIVDSDGDMRSLIPSFLEGGITGALPMEGAAGVNPVELRRQYPKLQLIGGLDKLIVAQGGEVMERYVTETLEYMAPRLGYVPSFDHSVHPSTSLGVYKSYLALLRQLVEKV